LPFLLIAFNQDKNSSVRFEAVYCLEKGGLKENVGPLIELLGGDPLEARRQLSQDIDNPLFPKDPLLAHTLTYARYQVKGL